VRLARRARRIPSPVRLYTPTARYDGIGALDRDLFLPAGGLKHEAWFLGGPSTSRAPRKRRECTPRSDAWPSIGHTLSRDAIHASSPVTSPEPDDQSLMTGGHVATHSSVWTGHAYPPRT
jgi:hypothetical protein